MDLQLAKVTVVLPSLWLGICAHEATQAWVASRLGDDTARTQGRLSLYPPRHLDLWGSWVAPLAMLLSANFGNIVIGWGRPVPVDPAKLRNPKRDYSLVALSGIGAYFAVAIFLAIMGRMLPVNIPANVALLLCWGILVNVTLGFASLMPLPGLDGMKSLFVFMSDAACYRFNRPEMWIFITGLFLLWRGGLNWVVWPIGQLTFALCRLGGLPSPVGNV